MEIFWLYLHVVKLRIYGLYVRSRLHSVGAQSSVHPPATLYKPQLISLGRKTVIREHAWLNAGRGQGAEPVLRIGNGCYIGRFVQINAANSVVLEDKVLVADKVYISDVDHKFSDPSLPVIDQGVVSKGKVLLREGCWIGTGAVILSGVTVGRNAIVGANSIVNRDVPDYAVVAGSPAKILRERSPNESK
jgi:acetyltransferase-like isoleucine patch superfamily enzyme